MISMCGQIEEAIRNVETRSVPGLVLTVRVNKIVWPFAYASISAKYPDGQRARYTDLTYNCERLRQAGYLKMITA